VGCYAQQLEPWFAAFDRRQILVLEMSATLADAAGAVARLASFVRLDAGAAAALPRSFPRSNANPYAGGGRARWPKQEAITCACRDALDAFFDPWNARLYALLAATADAAPPEEPRPFPRFPRFPCAANRSRS